MSKEISSFEISLNDRPKQTSVTRWLYEEVLRAVLDGRLTPGARLPASREFARLYGVSRGTVVNIFEQLQGEGYLRSQVGVGSWVNESLPVLNRIRNGRRVPAEGPPPAPVRLEEGKLPQAFEICAPVAAFPCKVWAGVAGRRLRRLSPSFLTGLDVRGCLPLREAVAGYLGYSRGVKCNPDQIAIVTGVQQGLDVLSRLLLKPGDSVWMEDPGYSGAAKAFRNVDAKLIPVPVDDQGLSVSKGKQLCSQAKGVYVTPGHQFPLGMAMSHERRLAILEWARESGTFIIEDDYDSAYRFEGKPLGALQGLDTNGSVIFVGSFNRILAPALRMGYVVLPPALVDPFLAMRYQSDRNAPAVDQMILCDFITEGHLGRHLSRTRDVYGNRLGNLIENARKHLAGVIEISPVQAGLHTAGFFSNGLTSRDAENRAAANRVETTGLDRFMLERTDVRGLLLGFAAFDEAQISAGVERLAMALGT